MWTVFPQGFQQAKKSNSQGRGLSGQFRGALPEYFFRYRKENVNSNIQSITIDLPPRFLKLPTALMVITHTFYRDKI